MALTPRLSPWLALVAALLLEALMPPLASPADDPPPLRSSSPQRAFLDALAAPGPAAALGEETATYSWLVGSWDVEVVDYPQDGPPRHGHGEWHFAWVLEGRGLADVWIAPPRDARPAATGSPEPGNRYGLSLRVWDAGLGAWRVTWFNPVTGVETRLLGRRVGPDIVQTGREEDGTLVRWTFTEVRPDGFLWRGEASGDEGATWRLEAEFRGRRRERSAAPGEVASEAGPEAAWTRHWRWTDRPGLEALVVSREGDAWVATSHVLVVLDGRPLQVSYRLTYDREWRFLRASLRTSSGEEGEAPRELDLARSGAGEWRVNGEPRPDLAGCSDLDVMVTPFTNTPALWRLSLAPGEARELSVAWVRFPELTVVPVRQEYRRLDEEAPAARFLYRNLESGFEGELTVDEHRLVVTYGPWRRVPSPGEDP